MRKIQNVSQKHDKLNNITLISLISSHIAPIINDNHN